MPVEKDPKVFAEDYNERPGMDNAERDMNHKTWDVKDPFKAVFHGIGYCEGPVVGSPYDTDPLGEERSRVTYPTNAVKPKANAK